MIMNVKRRKDIAGKYSRFWKNMTQLDFYDFDAVPPNLRFQPTPRRGAADARCR